MPNDLIFWNAIALTGKIGPKRFKKLYNYFPDMQTAFSASFSDLLAAGLEEKIAQEFILRRNEINPEAEWQKIEAEKLQLLTIGNEKYPRLLK